LWEIRKIRNLKLEIKYMAEEKNKIEELKSEAKKQVGGYILAGFGVVASLAWNEAIKAFIEHLFPLQQDSILAKFIYAVVMTLVLVIVSMYLIKLFQKSDKK
jgi:O-antigen/teichoic acid export membrane protein